MTVTKLEEKGIKGLIFDLYNTLIDIKTDEDSINTYEPVSKWLIYQGVKISAEDLRTEYNWLVKESMEGRWEKYPEVNVHEVFTTICKGHAVWEIDATVVGAEASRAFRAGSLRHITGIPSKHATPSGAGKLPQSRSLQWAEGILGKGDEVFRPL